MTIFKIIFRICHLKVLVVALVRNDISMVAGHGHGAGLPMCKGKYKLCLYVYVCIFIIQWDYHAIAHYTSLVCYDILYTLYK